MGSANLYYVCTMGYALAAAACFVQLACHRLNMQRCITFLIATAFLCHTAGMAYRWGEAGLMEIAAFEHATGMPLSGWARFVTFTQHPPWSNLYEILVFMGWGAVLATLWAQTRWRVGFLSPFAVCLALLALAAASLNDSLLKPLVPALRSKWILVHVLSASVAYACGSLTAWSSFLYLLRVHTPARTYMIAAVVLLLSGGIGLCMGGSSLLTTGQYWVRVYAWQPQGQVAVQQLVNNQEQPFWVISPLVGPAMFTAVVLWVGTAMLLLTASARKRQNSAWRMVTNMLHWAGTISGMLALAAMLYNGLTALPVLPGSQQAAQLYPSGPWQLSLRSHVWDASLLLIVICLQLLAGVCYMLPNIAKRYLPAANKLDTVAYGSGSVTFALMSVVLVTGALWAHYAWGRYWAWDPKEVGALLIWLTYAEYLHLRLAPYGKQWAPVVAAMGFFVILAGFLGVNLGWFAPGLHSYGSQ
ncbi:MAG: cytochrome c biogenesis protein CcsA [Myxococcota bacterium]